MTELRRFYCYYCCYFYYCFTTFIYFILLFIYRTTGLHHPTAVGGPASGRKSLARVGRRAEERWCNMNSSHFNQTVAKRGRKPPACVVLRQAGRGGGAMATASPPPPEEPGRGGGRSAKMAAAMAARGGGAAPWAGGGLPSGEVRPGPGGLRSAGFRGRGRAAAVGLAVWRGPAWSGSPFPPQAWPERCRAAEMPGGAAAQEGAWERPGAAVWEMYVPKPRLRRCNTVWRNSRVVVVTSSLSGCPSWGSRAGAGSWGRLQWSSVQVAFRFFPTIPVWFSLVAVPLVASPMGDAMRAAISAKCTP